MDVSGSFLVVLGVFLLVCGFEVFALIRSICRPASNTRMGKRRFTALLILWVAPIQVSWLLAFMYFVDAGSLLFSVTFGSTFVLPFAFTAALLARLKSCSVCSALFLDEPPDFDECRKRCLGCSEQKGKKEDRSGLGDFLDG